MIDDIIKREESRINGDVEKHKMTKVDGYVSKQKGISARRVASMIFEEDFKTVAKELNDDVIRPTIKDFVADLFIGGIERAIYGSSKRGRNGGRSSSPGDSLTRSYDSPSWRSYYQGGSRSESREPKERFTYNDIVMNSRDAAEKLLDEMEMTIRRFGYVSVSDLYDALDISSNLDYTDSYYGWKSLEGAKVRHVSDGYLVELPRPVQLTKSSR